MGIAEWMRVLDTVGGLAQLTGKLRARAPEEGLQEGGGPGVGGPLEARLAGVVVAALKEAFDRDRQRMELERGQIEAERRRVEEALAAELQRQALERTLGQLRLLAVMAISIAIAALLLFYSDFKGSSRFAGGRSPFGVLHGSAITYVAALFASAILLWFFGRFAHHAASINAAQCVVLGFPATLGAAAGRLLLR